MDISIDIQGDGSVSWISSSAGGKLLRSSDTNGSGVYKDGFDYKFLTNKVLVAIITSSLSGSIVFSPIDESFTVRSGTLSASIDVIFTPQQVQNNIFIPKPSSTGKVQNTAIITGFNFLNYTSPINIDAAQSGVTLPTTTDYQAGYMFRFFYKQVNNPAALVKEVSKVQFDTITGNFLYTTLSIKWKITGDEEAVKQINTNILNIADRNLPGIKVLLQRNLLQYWKPGSFSPQTQFDVTAKIQTQQQVITA